ncbi:MAG: tRNA uridine-5-carboxymethylaminomethyl(34) synthesis GTPase MnmE [Clostridia bacterium]|nr:tRNA uridine-5-carboxymethylaminomethyl(34) synthesis GTPase MnmE [Clostridia bacterium]
MELIDTIAAISTPWGKGGIAVIRISGSDAIEIGSKIFRSVSGKALSSISSSHMTYGQILSYPDGEDIDDGMAVVFRAPHSFTGEDTVEISCHGGILITEKVLSSALCAGARAATAGEFTRRAFVFGKMDLTQAEALGDLLEATGEGQLSLARNGMKGKLRNKTQSIYDSLKNTLTSIYAAIDFPDEDLSEMSREEICSAVKEALLDTQKLASTYKTGRAMGEGIPTVICGKTNAGKSSVYNRLLGYEAAIVTDIEGTTRDILKDTATVGRVTLRLCDTAGIRSTSDRVEEIGIERAMNELENASLALAVFDSSRELESEDIALAEKIKELGIPAIAIFNKSDLAVQCDMTELEKLFERSIHISAMRGDGFDSLKATLEEMFIDGDIDVTTDPIVTGARQFAAISSATEILDSALASLEADIPLDLCCVNIESAMSALGEVGGREIGEEIVGEIFSKFCVGK